MRKSISPWLAAAATAVLISAAAPGGKTVYADELNNREETSVTACNEEDGSGNLAGESKNENENSAADSETSSTDDVMRAESDESEKAAEGEIAQSENVDDEAGKSEKAANKEEEESLKTEEAVGEKAENSVEAEKADAESKIDTEVKADVDNSEETAKADAENKTKTDNVVAAESASIKKEDEVGTEAEINKSADNTDNKKAEGVKAEEVAAVVTNDESKMVKANGWVKDGDKWKYYFGNSEDQYYKNETAAIGSEKYIFDSNGNMRTGWIKDNTTGKYYYALPSGRLARGWQEIDGKWYYFTIDENGNENQENTMYSERLFNIESNKVLNYYFTKSGAMLTGWGKNSDGDWYHASNNGVLDQGWKLIDNQYYYFGDFDSVKIPSDIKEHEERFCAQMGCQAFLPDEVPFLVSEDRRKDYNAGRTSYRMAKAEVGLIDGEYYYFGDSGAMKTGWIKGKGWDVDGIAEYTYAYANPSGRMAEGWTKIDNEWYYFTGGIGYRGTIGTLSSAETHFYMLSNQVYRIDNKMYHFNSSGALNKEVPELAGVLSWPVDSSEITKWYTSTLNLNMATGQNEPHNGVDIACEVGSSVKAPLAGTIIYADDNGKGGKTIKIDCGNDIIITLQHLSEYKCKVGDKVTTGQEIALSGSTGASTGPHLHYSVQISGEYVNPFNSTFYEDIQYDRSLPKG